MSPLVMRLSSTPGIASRLCVTAQHRQMLDQALSLFGLEPDYDLDIMKPGQTLGGITGAILQGLEPVLGDFAPDIVLVRMGILQRRSAPRSHPTTTASP